MYTHLKPYNKRDIQILKYCFFPPSLIMKKLYSTSPHAHLTSVSVVTGATLRRLTVFQSYHFHFCLSTSQSTYDTSIHIYVHFRI